MPKTPGSGFLGFFAGALLLFLPGTGIAVPIMYGTDEDTAHFVRVENYDSTPVVTDYGMMSINDGGNIRAFPDTDPASSSVFSDIESFTLNEDGVAFMVGNGTVSFVGGGTFEGPHLYSIRVFNRDGTEALQIDDATASGGYNVLQPIGKISGIDPGEPINGIDFDPESGRLIGVVENGGRDDLIEIDPVTAVATILSASMDGTDDIEDMQFDSAGNLYLIDDDGGVSGSDDVLHFATLDRSGGSLSLDSISVVNNTGADHRIESLGYDFQTDRMIAFSDTSNSLFELETVEDGFIDLGGVGFNDIEGIDFVPTPTGLPVPEPSTVLLLTIGLALLSIRRERPRPSGL